MEDIYEKGFEEFIEEGLEAEKRGHYRAAVSNYYKAITEICGFLINKKTGKLPSSHSEIFLFLKINFPEVQEKISPAFDIYTKAYDSSIGKSECVLVKNVINEIASGKEISRKIRVAAGKIQSN